MLILFFSMGTHMWRAFESFGPPSIPLCWRIPAAEPTWPTGKLKVLGTHFPSFLCKWDADM